jgi:glycosyltransferase involved in cell wall biosynthesis
MAPTFMDVRTTQPMNALAKIPGVTTEMLIREMKVEPIKDKNIPHILILQRHIPQDAKVWKEKMLRVADMGWLVISEWDDHPDKLPAGIRERFGEAGWLAFKAAHVVQTSTNYLAEALKKYNQNIIIIENCVNKFSAKKPLINPKKIFFGALNRKQDWINIIEQINKIARENSIIEWEVVHDKEFYDILDTNNKTFHGSLIYEEYLKVMNKCDIALLPLSNTFENKCKSDIKYIEATSMGVACVASQTVYGNVIQNNKNGIIINNDNMWYKPVNELIVTDGMARRYQEKSFKYIQENIFF